ncbi:MAG: MBL fold metallo-hydrolase [Rhodoluna sp.]|nr:MBL fold metallo-hydrolase [Rhodoluna sp.]
MKLTKYGHACLIFEEQGRKLVLDPGAYTEPLEGNKDVLAVVITHAHDDHCFEAQLDRLIANNPGLIIFGPPQVCTRLSKYNTTAVYMGDHYPVGPFTLEFFGDLHAVIHPSIPVIENRAVLINDKVFYPGDSFTLPDRPVELLAVPTSAPWLKISEVMDFVTAIKHKHSMATHNALHSDFGNALSNGRVKAITEAQGGEFHYLLPGESLEI